MSELDERFLHTIGMFVALPDWFFGTIPTAEYLLDPMPLYCLVGQLSLAAGILLMVWYRRWALLAFLIPVAICQALVTVAGFMRGDIRTGIPAWLLFTFCAVQLVIIGYLIYRARGARLAAIFLGVFCIAYSLFASFVATMSFQDTFL